MTRAAGSVILHALKREPPRWAVEGLTRLEVIELAEHHGILPVLADIAVREGVIPDIELAAAIAARRDSLSTSGVLLAARQANRARHDDLDEIRALAVGELIRSDVPFRHLKGGALRQTTVWRDISARPTRDVDILVGDTLSIPLIESSLLELGFQHSDEVATDPAWEDDHHDRPMVLAGRSGSLELHAAPLVRRHRDRLQVDLPLTPGDEDLGTTLRHIVLHAQLQDDALLEFRLPIVPLLDVAFAIEAGLLDSSDLIRGFHDPLARRSARIHVGLAARLRGDRMLGGRVSRLRWWLSAYLFGHPRLAHLVREAAFAPRALSRDKMEARAGSPLTRLTLARARLRFIVKRVPRGLRGMPKSEATKSQTATPSAGGAMPTHHDDPREHPSKSPGFEAAWSSSGLVLVDLGTDVLHHLNGPAAVVYELVGERTVDHIVESYAALAGLEKSDAEPVVDAALDRLVEIGSITR